MADFSWKTTYVIYAQPEEVFEALTDPGIVAAWSGELSVIEPRVGGHVEFFDGWINGEVTHFIPGKELGFTWKPAEWDKRTAASKVHLRFMPHEAGTDLVLVHTGFPSQAEADKHANGWVDFILDPLNDYFVMNKEA